MERLNPVTVRNVKKDDIITRFPIFGKPENAFDPTARVRIEKYQVTALGLNGDVLGLVAIKTAMFPFPGEMRRLFIRRSDMVSELTWWIEDAK